MDSLVPRKLSLLENFRTKAARLPLMRRIAETFRRMAAKRAPLQRLDAALAKALDGLCGEAEESIYRAKNQIAPKPPGVPLSDYMRYKTDPLNQPKPVARRLPLQEKHFWDIQERHGKMVLRHGKTGQEAGYPAFRALPAVRDLLARAESGGWAARLSYEISGPALEESGHADIQGAPPSWVQPGSQVTGLVVEFHPAKPFNPATYPEPVFLDLKINGRGPSLSGPDAPRR